MRSPPSIGLLNSMFKYLDFRQSLVTEWKVIVAALRYETFMVSSLYYWNLWQAERAKWTGGNSAGLQTCSSMWQICPWLAKRVFVRFFWAILQSCLWFHQRDSSSDINFFAVLLKSLKINFKLVDRRTREEQKSIVRRWKLSFPRKNLFFRKKHHDKIKKFTSFIKIPRSNHLTSFFLWL